MTIFIFEIIILVLHDHIPPHLWLLTFSVTSCNQPQCTKFYAYLTERDLSNIKVKYDRISFFKWSFYFTSPYSSPSLDLRIMSCIIMYQSQCTKFYYAYLTEWDLILVISDNFN